MAARIVELTKLNFEDKQILSINFIGPKVISRINEQFVAHRGVTDVISFDYREMGADNSLKPTEEEIAGELFIYPGAAYLEGEKRKKSYFAYEMTLYIVHGILHLTGQDDLEPAARKRMRRKERTVMKKLIEEFNLRNIFQEEK